MNIMDRVANEMNNRAAEQAQLADALSPAGRDDEPGLLYAVGNNAHFEVTSDRSALRDVTFALRSDPDNPELHEKLQDVFSHLHYASDLQAYTTQQLQFLMREEHSAQAEQAAQDNPSAPSRLGRWFRNLRGSNSDDQD